jgi:uncharacterized BrkB/YihY/UPF0761 family membrane protein
VGVVCIFLFVWVCFCIFLFGCVINRKTKNTHTQTEKYKKYTHPNR